MKWSQGRGGKGEGRGGEGGGRRGKGGGRGGKGGGRGGGYEMKKKSLKKRESRIMDKWEMEKCTQSFFFSSFTFFSSSFSGV